MELIFDKTELIDRLMGDEELADEILNDFVEDAPRYITEIKKSLYNGDNNGIRSSAHALKGSAANIGAGELRRIAIRLEKASGSENLDDVVDLVQQLEEQYEIFCAIVSDPGITEEPVGEK